MKRPSFNPEDADPMDVLDHTSFMNFVHGKHDNKGYRFLSNIHNDDRKLIDKAKTITKAKIDIKKRAEDMWGNIVPGHFSVWGKDRVDYKPFWDQYRKLYREAKGETT